MSCLRPSDMFSIPVIRRE